jgi:aryl-phospho-beta-D-glucosidase BglC (GH1 family)
VDEDEMILLRQKLATAKEKVIRVILKLVSTSYAEAHDDPGWETEMYEEMFENAVVEYVTVLASVKDAQVE